LVPAITFHGGPVLSHVDVNNVFYGQSWKTTDPWGIGAAYLDKFQADITKSPYMSMLGEYGVGQGQFDKVDGVIGSSSPAAGSKVGDSQIQAMLTTEIFSGRLPWETGQQLYFVYLSPNVQSKWDVANNTLGHHGSYLLPYFNTPVYYAVIVNPIGNSGFNGSLTTYQNLTLTSSHELAEAATDPDLRQGDTGNAAGGTRGWIDSDPYNVTWSGNFPIFTPNPNYGSEIGDLVNTQVRSFTTNGTTYTVQAEWSNYYGRGILANGSLTSPPAALYFVYNSWNNGGRTANYFYLFGTDGRTYLDFQTAAGDWSGWFTIQ
jgi:hypothetical protein